MKTKAIELGYIAMSDYTHTTDLNFGMFADEKKVDADETVLTKGTYTLVIDYPLTSTYKQKFTTKGMTRRGLVNLIVKAYHKIYDAEDKDVGKKTGHIEGMLNRATSAGRYGIWGHDLGDLMLATAQVQKSGNITLGVDS